MTATCSIHDIVGALRDVAASARWAGAIKELQEVSGPEASVRVRLERGRLIGELTAWGHGSAHLVILDLDTGDFVFERDGVSLQALGTGLLQEFLARMEPTKALVSGARVVPR
jgi:hypothetical protein